MPKSSLDMKIPPLLPVIAGTLALLFALLCGGQLMLQGGDRQYRDRVADQVEHLSRDILPLVRALDAAKLDVVQVQQFLSDISATRAQDGLNDGLEDAQRFAEKFGRDLAAAETLSDQMGLPEIKRLLVETGTAFAPYYATGKAMAAAYIDQGTTAGNRLMPGFDATSEKLQQALEALDQPLNNMVDRHLASLHQQLDGQASLSDWHNWLINGLAIIGLILAGGLWHQLRHWPADRPRIDRQLATGTTAADHRGPRFNIHGISARMLLLILILLVPIANLLWQMTSEQLETIAVTARERDGGLYIAAARDLVLVTAENGQTSDLRPAVAGLAAAGQRYDADLSTAAAASAVLTASDNQTSALDRLDKLQGFITHVADQSGLTLDPAIDSYYVMDTVSVKLPGIVTGLAGLAAQIEGAGETGDMSLEQRIALSEALAVFTSHIGSMTSDLERAFGGSADDRLRLALAPVLERAIRDLTTVATTLAQATGDGQLSPAERQAATGTLQSALAAIAPLWQSADQQLQRLLVERIDDLSRQLWSNLVLAGLLILASLIALVFIGRSITRPITCLTDALRHMAAGALDLDVPGTERRDELGLIAQGIADVRDSAAERSRIETETQEHDRRNREQAAAAAEARIEAERRTLEEQNRAQGEIERARALHQMAEKVEHFTEEAVGHVVESTSGMTQSAAEMSEAALSASDNAQGVSAATTQMLASIEAVASATEQLNASIKDVSGQMKRTESRAVQAAELGGQSAARISALTHAVSQIGDVVRLISGIAGQTNLLALNATIEAARAGEAGRGFSVVAQEVKTLASQTARSADDIVRMVGEINTATAEAAASVSEIVQQVEDVRDAASMISAAVEQQTAATSEISRRLGETVGATQEVAQRINHVSAQVSHTGALTAGVARLAGMIDDNVRDLQHSIVQSLRSVDSTVDRRHGHRVALSLAALITWHERDYPVEILDVSQGGIRLTIRELPPGMTGGTAVRVMLPRGIGPQDGDIVVIRDKDLHIRWRQAPLDEAVITTLTAGPQHAAA